MVLIWDDEVDDERGTTRCSPIGGVKTTITPIAICPCRVIRAGFAGRPTRSLPVSIKTGVAWWMLYDSSLPRDDDDDDADDEGEQSKSRVRG